MKVCKYITSPPITDEEIQKMCPGKNIHEPIGGIFGCISIADFARVASSSTGVVVFTENEPEGVS